MTDCGDGNPDMVSGYGWNMDSVPMNTCVPPVNALLDNTEINPNAELCDGQINGDGIDETDVDGDGYVECIIDSGGWDGL